MDFLPEDVLVHIFSFLTPADLLGSVRAVCRTWRALALHWDAWSRSELLTGWGVRNDQLLRRAARFAPRLHSLQLNELMPAEPLDLIAARRCRITCLEVSSQDDVVVRLLRSQVQFVRYLTVHIQEGDGIDMDVWQCMQDMRLVKLAIIATDDGPFDEDDFLFSRPASGSSLRRLVVHAYLIHCEADDRVIASLVQAHADSLEAVKLSYFPARKAIAMLGECLRVREVKVALVNEVAVLRACKNLTSLTLYCFKFDHSIPDTCAYMQDQCLQLLSLTLTHLDVDDDAFSALLLALASSGCARLQSLHLLTLCWVTKQSMPRLCGVMHDVLSGLPSLQELRLPGVLVSCALEQGGVAAFPTGLHLLDLREQGRRSCVPLLLDLLRALPTLHVIGFEPSRVCRCCADQTLDAFDCINCCRKHVKGARMNDTCLFAHCPSLVQECAICAWICGNYKCKIKTWVHYSDVNWTDQ